MAKGPSDAELVDLAAGLLNPRRLGDRLFGDVASVLVTEAGNQFGGVCIDTLSGTGFWTARIVNSWAGRTRRAIGCRADGNLVRADATLC